MMFPEQYSLTLPDLPERRWIIAAAVLIVAALLVGMAYDLLATLRTKLQRP